MTQLEKAALRACVRAEFGDDAIAEVEQACDDVTWTPEGTEPCICGDILGTLLVLP